MKIEQWDIVRFRINPADRDLHPGIVISAPEWCADDRKVRLNVLACSKRVPAEAHDRIKCCSTAPTDWNFRACADANSCT